MTMPLSVIDAIHQTRATAHRNILYTVGNTPIVRINKLAPEGVNMFVKLEAFNPLGSVKDRLALAIIEAAEIDGSLRPGQTVVEATSGNTGIGLAMVCAQKGYPLVVVMAENFSIERRRLMRYLGAKVILTPASEKGTGMVNKAKELATKHGWFLCRQFENEANARVHANTTAKEILEVFKRQSLDYFITGYGTGGTLKGIAQTLRRESPQTRIITCEPDNSAMLSSGIPQSKTVSQGSHPAFRPHLMQGIAPDFISRLTEDAVNAQLIDKIVPVSGEDALHYARQLARQEGIFCGISSGAAFAAAHKVASAAPSGANVLCMLPDTGERYMSTPLFDEVMADMNDEEMAISRSTPNHRFDVSPNQAAPTTTPKVTTKAQTFIDQICASKTEPVVMFSLEWCEFCWSVRKLFKRMKLAYRVINLDSVEYQQDNWGADIRNALQAATGAATIPQIFVGRHHIGGCSETFDAYKDGSLAQRLAEAGINTDIDPELDPYSLFPNWLQKR